MHSYCASIFLIPTGIMKKVDSICRNFLWGGKDAYLRSPNVSWGTCCSPMEEGGLGLQNASHWNKALIGKYTSWLATKKDHVWVKWVNHVYKKAGYHWLRTQTVKVPWRFLCWNNLNVPKHSFIFWVSQHYKLLTLDRMARMGLGSITTCFICGLEDESHAHLFYNCVYSKKCVGLLQDKLQMIFPADNMVKWYSLGRGRSGLQRIFTGACFVGLTYAIWNARNHARLYSHIIAPWVLVNHICKDIKLRFELRNKSPLKQYDKDWIDNMSKALI
ncbi:uncharacterized protein LOC141651717 [Silene latifolia]|uniref:uncharacterized protein LOC141651717 n=1 Tax=Silene latifolia TaxID=37657 RepID=UPI003D77D62D